VTFRAIEGGKALATMDFHGGRAPSGLALCPDAPFAVAGPRVYSLQTGKVARDLGVNGVAASAFLPGGRLALLDARNTLTVWDLETGALASTMKGKREKARSMVVDPAGRRAVTYTDRLRFELWDLQAAALLAAYDAEEVHRLWMAWCRRRRLSLVGVPLGPEPILRFTADASRLLLGGFGLRTVDLERREVRFGVVATASDRTSIDAWPLPGGRHVAVLGSRQLIGGAGIEIWDLDAQVLVGWRSLEIEGSDDDDNPPQTSPRTMALAPGGLVVGYDDGIRTFRLTAREGPLPAQPPLEELTVKLRAEPFVFASPPKVSKAKKGVKPGVA
jgi:hypothetical protein